MEVYINGVLVSGLIWKTDAEACVLLVDGSRVTVPASNPLYADVSGLTNVSLTPVVPEYVSNAQARAALRAAGVLANVEATISAASADTQDAWNNSPYIRRDSSLVASLGAAIGLTDLQIDDLFIAAEQIQF